jgi:hypothetical protein
LKTRCGITKQAGNNRRWISENAEYTTKSQQKIFGMAVWYICFD